jgi:hypothetical protein
MGFRIIRRPTDREIDRAIDADLVACGNLGAEQVELEIGMRVPDLGGVVAPTVVALGEDVDVVDMARAKRVLPLRLVKPLSDPGD